MNRVFDYNGTIVAPSNPVKKLKTVKRKLIVDSGDRDKVKYSTNGDFVVYLPRVYENVVSIRLEAGEFPPLTGPTTPNTDPIPVFYSDSGAQENIANYTPAIGKLDRMHIRTRLHKQKTSGDWFFWKTGEYSLTFEIEYLDNVFDDFSQFESRVSERA